MSPLQTCYRHVQTPDVLLISFSNLDVTPLCSIYPLTRQMLLAFKRVLYYPAKPASYTLKKQIMYLSVPRDVLFSFVNVHEELCVIRGFCFSFCLSQVLQFPKWWCTWTSMFLLSFSCQHPVISLALICLLSIVFTCASCFLWLLFVWLTRLFRFPFCLVLTDVWFQFKH